MDKGLLLDRDGVVCKALDGYLLRLEDFELMPGIRELVRAAKEKGYKVAVVTNQPQIGKGLLAESHLAEIHEAMAAGLEGLIDKIYYCPHVDADGCECRKPRPGMMHQAGEELNLDLARSILVGDSDRDILAGRAAGCRTVFVRNPLKGHEAERCAPDHVVDELAEIHAIL
jgi:D-glycero-D-manno-heptose 1,7-bisphosphate phosphatase